MKRFNKGINIPKCCICGGDECSLIKDKTFGWLCFECESDLNDDYDVDEHESNRRIHLAEENEY